MEAIIIQPRTKEDLNLFKQMAKRLKAAFETKPLDITEHEKAVKLYGKKFVDKIDLSSKELSEGKGTVISMDELKKLCK